MFSDVVYYHCSEFQIFRPLNGSHFLVSSFYPHSVQNQAWFCLHFSDHGKPKQTDVIFSPFVSLSLVNHGRLPRKNWPIAGFSPLFWQSWSNPHLNIRPIAIFAFYLLNYSLAARLQGNSRPKSPTKVETKRKLHQLTFPEFHFETETKVDFPSACI